MNRRHRIAFWLLALVVIFVAFVELVAPFDPLAQDAERRLEPPGSTHLMGTDGFGRDQFSRVLIGARNSLLTALIALSIAAPIGFFVGALSAYLSGVFDLVVQRIVDLFLGIPFLVFCIIFVIALRPSVGSVGLALAFVLTPQITRLARSSVLAVTHEPYVEASILCGAPTLRIVFRHLMPNALPPMIAHLSGLFGTSIAAEASLSFLGLGIPPPYPSLGRMLREGAGLMLEAAPWLTLFPGIVIAAMVFIAAFTGDSLTRKPASSVSGNRLPSRSRSG